MVKLKSENIQNSSGIVFEYETHQLGIPNPPSNMPVGMPKYSYVGVKPVQVPTIPPVEMPEASLPRAINYYADYGGCGFWRMIWPEMCLNAYQKAVISGLTCMVLDLRFYQNIKTIRMQRQATPVQNAFIKQLHGAKSKYNYRLLYEVDDIVFKDDIPDYNRCKEAFCDENIVKSITEIMSMMDEITVTCDFMKQYYINKTGNKKITVIPNYAPKFWLDRFYDKKRLMESFEKNKKQPRILYAGSGTHIDVANKTGMKDDFHHVVEEIIKARKKFKFVWKGCYPLAIKPFIQNGEMEYLDWSALMDLPEAIFNANCNATFAPLMNNTFNKSKSDIKIIESGAFGMPGTYQDLCTYAEAEFKFESGKDLISQLEYITSDYDRYAKLSENSRNFTETRWLENHLDKYMGLYTTEWGSAERNRLYPDIIRLNPDQKI